MKKSLSWLGLLVLLTASQAFGKAATTTQVIQERDVPILAISDCNGTEVNGTAHLVVRLHQTINGAGGINTRIFVSFSGSGSDADGNTFSFNVQDHEVAATSNGKAVEVSESITANLIGHGSTFNETLHGVLHLTISANGVTTAEVDSGRTSCR